MFLVGAATRFSGRAKHLLGVAAYAAVFLAASGTSAQVPAELRIRVSDAATGRAIVGARIQLADRADEFRSGADGASVIRGLEPGAYSLTIAAVGYAAVDRDAEIVNGRATTLEVSLSPIPIALAAAITTAPRSEVAEAAAAFDRAAIESSGRRDLGELIAAVPGIVVTRSGGPGQPSQASIRGSSPAEVLVIVDGIVANSPLTGVADLSQIPLAIAERVTVLEGAQSARYGGGALAGVIVVETRHASRDATLDVGAGSWGERRIGASIGDGATTSDLASGLLSAEHRDIRGDFPYAVPDVRGGGTARRSNSDASSTNVLGIGSLGGSLGTARIRADARETSRGLAGSIVQPSLTARDGEHHSAADLQLDSRPATATLSASASIARDYSHFSDPTPPFGSSYDDVLTATESRLASSAAVGRSSADATIGGDARWLNVESTSLAVDAPRGQRVAGAYADLHASRDVAGFSAAAHLADRVDEDDRLSRTFTSPRASLELTHGVASLSGSIANGFSPPSLGDQFFHEGVLVRANPSLGPERTRAELVARVAVHDASVGGVFVSADASAFRANVDGMILWSPDFRFIWSPANVDVHRTGWQLSGRLALASEGIAVSGGVDRADVSYVGAAQTGQVVYRPRTTARITESFAKPFGRLDVETRFVGMRRTVAGSDVNALAPYWTTDVHITAPLVRASWRLDATAGVDNVFDRAASMLVDYPFGPRRWTVGLRTSRAGGP